MLMMQVRESQPNTNVSPPIADAFAIVELLQVMVPQVQELIGTSHSTEDEITEALRKANYDVEQTVQVLLEKPQQAPAAPSTRT